MQDFTVKSRISCRRSSVNLRISIYFYIHSLRSRTPLPTLSKNHRPVQCCALILFRDDFDTCVSAQQFPLPLKTPVQEGKPCMCDHFSDTTEKVLPIHQALVLPQRFNELNKRTSNKWLCRDNHHHHSLKAKPCRCNHRCLSCASLFISA
jgi:hypothetical protein